MHPTPYPDLNAVLQELVQRVEEVLRRDFVGAYMQGSFAVGDFDEHSDVDWIVAIENPLGDDQVAALQDVHAQVYDLDCLWDPSARSAAGPNGPRLDWIRRGRP